RAVEIADLHVRLHHHLAVELGEDPDDAVHGRMRRPQVDEEVLAAPARSGALAEEQLPRLALVHIRFPYPLVSPAAASRSAREPSPYPLVSPAAASRSPRSAWEPSPYPLVSPAAASR